MSLQTGFHLAPINHCQIPLHCGFNLKPKKTFKDRDAFSFVVNVETGSEYKSFSGVSRLVRDRRHFS